MDPTGVNEADGSSSFHSPHFDVVTEFDDHHYIKSKSSKPCLHDGNSPVYATIMKEWRILQKNLPDSIYVRVHESHIDLLRAVIIGPAGTPYHDGLFFFDICLPSDYPHSPPEVYYHSFGYRLNPNLYENGRVCLSLLNTWSGSGTEKWTQASTILQILVSIQGLVLNARPYFNEPAYVPSLNSKSPGVISASLAYNENAFILSCYTMIYIMQKPPKTFEDFVVQHFRLRSASILAAVKAYSLGAVLVGQFQTNAGSSTVTGIKVNDNFITKVCKVEDMLQKNFARLASDPTVKTVESSSKGSEGMLQKALARLASDPTVETVESSSKGSEGVLQKAFAILASDPTVETVETSSKGSEGMLQKALAILASDPTVETVESSSNGSEGMPQKSLARLASDPTVETVESSSNGSEGMPQKSLARLASDPIVETMETMESSSNGKVTNGGKKRAGFWKKLIQCINSK